MPGPIIATLCILAACGAVVGGMLLGWRVRQRKQAGLGTVSAIPETLGAPSYEVRDAHYVGTSMTGNALDRIAIRPLAYRGRADLEVHDEGVAVAITGETPFLIPADAIETVATAQATIDRAVERDGLIVIRWHLDAQHSVESYFRIVDPLERARTITVLNGLVPATPPAQTSSLEQCLIADSRFEHGATDADSTSRPGLPTDPDSPTNRKEPA